MTLKAGRKGSITVEAAIILPFFILTIIFFIFLMKVYYTNEIIQSALSGASRQMSVYSLLYYKTNADEIISGIEKLGGTENVQKALGNSWLASSIKEAGKYASDYTRAQLVLIPSAKHLVERQLEDSLNNKADRGLRSLYVLKGLEGLQYGESTMLADGRSIDISVSYQINFPILSQILPALKLKQTASVCVWAGEYGVESFEGDAEDNESIWDMSNLKRGQEIRKLQGANLPFNFPTIAKFHNGTAVSIKSLNTEEPYYSKPANFEKTINGYINKLGEFEGASCGSVTVHSSQILSKELIIVIPEIELTINQKLITEKCIRHASQKGITLRFVKAYGKPGSGGKAEENHDNTKDKSQNQ